MLRNTAGTPLALTAKAGTPPLKVNSSVKVGNLNSDRLDGLDSRAFALASASTGRVTAIGVPQQDKPEDLESIAVCFNPRGAVAGAERLGTASRMSVEGDWKSRAADAVAARR